jgi:hypothetical protein
MLREHPGLVMEADDVDVSLHDHVRQRLPVKVVVGRDRRIVLDEEDRRSGT